MASLVCNTQGVTTTVSSSRLYGALDAARQDRGISSWRKLADEIGVSPSTLSRLGQGQRPDADGFATLVSWLGVPAETFFDRDEEPTGDAPDLMPQLAALLRADGSLSEDDVQIIETVAKLALKKAQGQ
jgi:transcriptional regulator with XRE-family HTH domain